MKNKLMLVITGVFLLIFSGGSLGHFNADKMALASEGMIFKSARTHLDSVEVYKIVKVRDLKDIRQALEEAKLKGLKISIAGRRHSQGGQQSYPHGIVLDMTEFNKIISLDKKNKIIRAQSGVTWEQIKDYIRPFGYAVSVKQNVDFLTVGGSLSANIHGQDPNYGTVIETVKSFHLMQADGKVVQVSRQENPELFSLVIGGYGLFGVIVDADLLLMDNVVYQKNSVSMDYQEYPGFFQSHIFNNVRIGEHAAYFSGSENGDFNTLRVVTNSTVSEDNKALADLSVGRKGEYISRDDPVARKPPEYNGRDHIGQVYFVPISKFVYFVDSLNKILEPEKNVNVKPDFIGYVKKDSQSFLPYAKVDSFAIALSMDIKQPLSADELKDIQHLTWRIVDLALNCGGTFYLAGIAIYPDKEQLFRAYPEFNEFIKKKEKYDPQEIFMNQFYGHYL